MLEQRKSHRGADWSMIRSFLVSIAGLEVGQKLMSDPKTPSQVLESKEAIDWDVANYFYVAAMRHNAAARILYLENNRGPSITMCLVKTVDKKWVWVAWGVERSVDTIPPNQLLSKLYGPFGTLSEAVRAAKWYYRGRFNRDPDTQTLSPEKAEGGFIQEGIDTETLIEAFRAWPKAPKGIFRD